MLDNRIYTFLELCTVMNYRKTAENLNLTQPAVTQHIQFLEAFYQCKLFDYSNRKLSKTAKGIALEQYARGVASLDLSVQTTLQAKQKTQINIGATKTIGEYVLSKTMLSLVGRAEYQVNLTVDNTENLLQKLNRFELDVLLLEGFVDKNTYLHQKISEEELVGICSVEHPFAFQEVSVADILPEPVVFREKGSGTRSIFEAFLRTQGFGIDSFPNQSIISSNHLIETIVQNNAAISFVYGVIQQQNPRLAYFKIANHKISHEFNFVFLNQEKADGIIGLLNIESDFHAAPF